MVRTEDIALVVFIACTLLFMLWVWYRAPPGSGERVTLPTLMLLSVSMLVGTLPRVLWPTADRVKIAGSIASMILTLVSVIAGIRRSRSLRSGAHHR